MIKLIDNPDEFYTFNKDDIFFIRIMSLLKAYSTEYNFALFYKQIDESENITAIIYSFFNLFICCHCYSVIIDKDSDPCFFGNFGAIALIRFFGSFLSLILTRPNV